MFQVEEESMSRIKKVLLLSSLAVLVLLLVFGCSLLLRDDSGVPASDGWCIKLKISAPAGSKGITVTDYQVTGLEIEVRGPDERVLKTIGWEAKDGPQSYLIPVKKLGQHEIVVTHIGEKNGHTVEATESAAFNIRAMVITVIDIVPGCIGVIRVEPEGQEPPTGPWILGCWVQSTTTAPHSMTFECRADGTFTVWDSYFATGDDIETYGTWSIEGSTLTGNSVHFGPFTWEITKVSDDLFLLPDTLEGPEGAFYRRGTEPGGWVFDQTPVPLSTGVWTEGDVEDLSMDLYSFTAPAAGYYAPEFKSLVSTDPENPSGFPYVYAADKLTELSADWDEDEYDLDAVAMNAGNLIYIVVDARDGGGGSYAIRVVKVQ
jgi:hypothetical protein